MHIKAMHSDTTTHPSLTTAEIKENTDRILESAEFAVCSKQFKTEIR